MPSASTCDCERGVRTHLARLPPPALCRSLPTCGMCIILEKPSRKCVISPRLPLPGGLASCHARAGLPACMPQLGRLGCSLASVPSTGEICATLLPPSFLPVPRLGQHGRHRVMAKHSLHSACLAADCLLDCMYSKPSLFLLFSSSPTAQVGPSFRNSFTGEEDDLPPARSPRSPHRPTANERRSVGFLQPELELSAPAAAASPPLPPRASSSPLATCLPRPKCRRNRHNRRRRRVTVALPDGVMDGGEGTEARGEGGGHGAAGRENVATLVREGNGAKT